MKRIFAVLLAGGLALAPVIVARCEVAAAAACPMAQGDCCSNHATTPVPGHHHASCPDCVFCPATCPAMIFSAGEVLTIPAQPVTRLRSGEEKSVQRTDQPPVPPPRC